MRSKLVITVVTLAAAAAFACGGGGDNAASQEQAAPTTAPPQGGALVVTAAMPTALSGAGAGGLANVPVSGVAKVTPTPTPLGATATPAPTATPTAPPRAVGEKGTGSLVDELSFEDYPRTTARQVVSDFRSDADAAAAQYLDKAHVIQGTVREASRDPDGTAWVIFSAGRGSLKCVFSAITDAALLRLTPGGTNATTGTPREWDPETLRVTATDCQIVKGF